VFNFDFTTNRLGDFVSFIERSLLLSFILTELFFSVIEGTNSCPYMFVFFDSDLLKLRLVVFEDTSFVTFDFSSMFGPLMNDRVWMVMDVSVDFGN
jgi:hypothetical protein